MAKQAKWFSEGTWYNLDKNVSVNDTTIKMP